MFRRIIRILSKGERLLAEIEYFKNLKERVSSTQITEHLGIARSTLQIDLQVLERFGAAFDSTEGRNGGILPTKTISVLDIVSTKVPKQKVEKLLDEQSADNSETLKKIINELAISILNES